MSLLRRAWKPAAAFLHRDPLGAMRLVLMVALLAATPSLIGIWWLPGVTPLVAAICCLLTLAVIGAHFLHYRGVWPVPAWFDLAEVATLLVVVLLLRNHEAILFLFFQLSMWRGSMLPLRRLLPVLAGYGGLWLAAHVLVGVRIDWGAMISMMLIGVGVYGMRALLLRTQDHHRAEQARLEKILHGLPSPVIVTDHAGTVLLANPATLALTGWSPGSTPALSTIDARDANGELIDVAAMALSTAQTGTACPRHEATLTRADGTTSQITLETVPMAHQGGQIPNVVVALVDITAQRLYEEYLHHIAYYDTLTGLPNRRLLWQHLNKAVHTGQPYAILMIDLNDFKAVNDNLGHQIGDELLQGVAARLRGVGGEAAIVSRLGGDEFAILLPGADQDRADAVAGAARRCFAEPFALSCGPVNGGGSVGAAAAEPGQLPDDLIAAADMAMYRAKPSGRRRRTNPALAQPGNEPGTVGITAALPAQAPIGAQNA
jgi:diguanylate cyclase (GGDEF)-like protein/PAS domain S-box-containing protein